MTCHDHGYGEEHGHGWHGAGDCGCGGHHGEPCHGTRVQRFMEPCLLLLLADKSSYGYDLAGGLEAFGFDREATDLGAVYRALRRLEAQGLVRSRWEPGEQGPQKRLYEVTEDGFHILHEWARRLRSNRTRLELFLKRYEEKFEKK